MRVMRNINTSLAGSLLRQEDNPAHLQYKNNSYYHHLLKKVINMALIKRVAILGGTGAQGSSVVRSK